MTKRKQAPSSLTPLPMLPTEAIYIGVDSGRNFKHVAGFVSINTGPIYAQLADSGIEAFARSTTRLSVIADRVRRKMRRKASRAEVRT